MIKPTRPVGSWDDEGGNWAVTGGGVTPPFKIKKKPFDGNTKILFENEEKNEGEREKNLVVGFLHIFLNEWFQ